MKNSLPNIAAACFGLLAGALLVIASRESQTQASHEPTAITIPEQATVSPSIPAAVSYDETVAVPVVEESERVTPPPAFVSSDCPGGVFAAGISERLPLVKHTRRGLFGGRFRR